MIPNHFYDDTRGLDLKDLGITMPKPNDETMIMTIPTPRGWKCRRRIANRK